MCYTVCKDLHKTYPEVRQLRPEELLWHYHNAIRYKEERNEELLTLMEFHMACTNPILYREHMKTKGGTVHEVATFKENMTEVEFLRYADMAEQQYKPSKPSTEELQEAASRAAQSDNSANTRADVPTPPTWGRPSHLPPVVVLDVPAASDNDTPQSSTTWE